MKKNTFRILSLAFVLGLALVAICFPEFSAEVLTFLGLGGSSGVMLGASFNGASTRKGEADLSPTLIARYVHEQVTTRRAQDVPLDTIMRSIRKPTAAHDFVVEYLEHTYTGFSDAADGAVTGGGATDTLTVDDGTMWSVDDLIRVPSVNPSAGDELILLVEAVSTNDLTVRALNNGGTVPAIADNAVIYKAGNSKNEDAATTSIVFKQPETLSNYCQIFMAQIQQTVYAARAKKVGGFTYQNYVDEVVYNYKSNVAMAQMFNPSKVKHTTSTGKDKFVTQGAYHVIQNTVNFGTGSSAVNPDLDDIYTLGESIWAGKDASQNKLMLAGASVIKGLANITSYQRDLSAREREIYHGVKVTSLTTPWGDIKVVYDPLMDKAGKSNEAVVLDLDHVYKHEFKPLEGTPLDLDRTGTARVQNAMRWDEASCLTVRYAGSTGVHAVWKPTA